MPSRRVRRSTTQTRARYTRTGDRDIRINDPDGYLTEPAIGQPPGDIWGGGGNPRFHWLGSDQPWHLLDNTAGERLASVHRATGLIADTLAGVPWHVFRGRDRLPTPSWVRDPQNAQGDARVGDRWPSAMPAVPFWSHAIVSMLWHGECFLYTPDLDEYGYPRAPIFQLNPADVDRRDGDWWVDDFRLDPWRLIHILGRAPYDDDGRGVGVLTRHARALGLAVRVGDYAAGTFSSGVPAGYLKVSGPNNLTPETAQALKDKWMSSHGGSSRSIAVLNATTEFHPIAMSPVDAELLGMSQFTRTEIAHAFGMSAHYLDVAGGSGTYANVTDRALDFRQLTLLPWARLIESTVDTRLPVGHELKLRLDGLERGTTSQRMAVYAQGLAAGVYTVDEVRDLENLPPLPQAQMLELEEEDGDG